MDGPNSGRTLGLLPRGDVKRMLDRGFTNDNIAARQRGFEPLPHRRNGPDGIQGLFCLWTVPIAAEPSASSPEGMSSECLTGGLRMTISPRDSASSSPFRTAEMVLMKFRAFFVVSRSRIVSFTRSEVILARDGKELPIGKTYLDNVLRAMNEGGS